MNIIIIGITILLTCTTSFLIISLKLNNTYEKRKQKDDEEYNNLIDKYNILLKQLDEQHLLNEKNKSVIENRNEIIRKMLENISKLSSNKVEPKYNIDDILTEINENGIENVDKDKIEFLKNNKY